MRQMTRIFYKNFKNCSHYFSIISDIRPICEIRVMKFVL